MKMHCTLKSAMLVICLAINTANASDGYPAEELTTATAPDSGNYGDLGQARFINGKYVAPLLTLPELSAEEIATLATRRSAQVRGGKPLQTGVGRDLIKQIAHTGAENVDTDVTWRLLNFSVASKGALALRLGFALEYPKAAAGLTLRFGGSDGEVFEVAGSALTEDAVQSHRLCRVRWCAWKSASRAAMRWPKPASSCCTLLTWILIRQLQIPNLWQRLQRRIANSKMWSVVCHHPATFVIPPIRSSEYTIWKLECPMTAPARC